MNFLEKLACDVNNRVNAKLLKLGAGVSVKGPAKPGVSAGGAAVSKSPTAKPPTQRPAAPVPAPQMSPAHPVNPPTMNLQVTPINGSIPTTAQTAQPAAQ